MKFIVKENKQEIIIEQKTISRYQELLVSVMGFILTLSVLSFPYDQLIGLHKYAFIVYFVPIIPLFQIIRKIIKIHTGHRFTINSKADQIKYNDSLLDRMTNIKQVEWNIDSITRHRNSYLELKSTKNLRHRISTTGTVMNKEHLELGRILAKFLKVKFINNHPYEKEVLWGNYDADEKSINHLENNNY